MKHVVQPTHISYTHSPTLPPTRKVPTHWHPQAVMRAPAHTINRLVPPRSKILRATTDLETHNRRRGVARGGLLALVESAYPSGWLVLHTFSKFPAHSPFVGWEVALNDLWSEASHPLDCAVALCLLVFSSFCLASLWAVNVRGWPLHPRIRVLLHASTI